MEKGTERLANLREDLKLWQDTSSDKFRMILGQQMLDNRGVAGELILHQTEKIKARFGEDIRLGKFAGFNLFIRAGFNDTTELVLLGRNSYSTRIAIQFAARSKLIPALKSEGRSVFAALGTIRDAAKEQFCATCDEVGYF